MLPHFVSQHIFIAAALYAAAALSTLIWLRFGHLPQTVSRSLDSSWRTVLRLFAVFIAITLLCFFSDIAGDRFDAISETGAFVGIETSIVVSSVNGDKLVVRGLRTS